MERSYRHRARVRPNNRCRKNHWFISRLLVKSVVNGCEFYAGIIRKSLMRMFLYADVFSDGLPYSIQHRAPIRVNAPGEFDPTGGSSCALPSKVAGLFCLVLGPGSQEVN